MALRGLLVSPDSEVLAGLRHVLQELGMQMETCDSVERADEILERRKYDVVVMDCDALPGAAAVLARMRRSSANRNTVACAILSPAASVNLAFELGANLTLKKPITSEAAVHSFRAAHVIAEGERRQLYRHKLEMPVTITLPESEMQATSTDISEAGMALRVPQPLVAKTPIQVRFMLPGGKSWISANAMVIWGDEEGCAGVRFDKLPAGAHEEYERWLTERAKAVESSINSCQQTPAAR